MAEIFAALEDPAILSVFVVPLLLNIVVAFVTSYFTEKVVRKREREESEQREAQISARRASEAFGHLQSAYQQIESSERYILRYGDQFDDDRVSLVLGSIETQLDALRAQMIGNVGQWKGDMIEGSNEYEELEKLVERDRARREFVARTERKERTISTQKRQQANLGSKGPAGQSETIEGLNLIEDKLSSIDPKLAFISLHTAFHNATSATRPTIVKMIRKIGDDLLEIRDDLGDAKAPLLNLISMGLYAVDEYEDAAKYSRMAIQEDPNVAAYRGNLIDNLIEMDESAEAADAAAEILDLYQSGRNADDPVTPLSKSYSALVKAGKHEEAEKALEAIRGISEVEADNAVLRAKISL
jgi:tetratricopeptide (TPR) repeat protein